MKVELNHTPDTTIAHELANEVQITINETHDPIAGPAKLLNLPGKVGVVVAHLQNSGVRVVEMKN